MANEVRIVVSAKDEASPVVSRVATNTKAMAAEVDRSLASSRASFASLRLPAMAAGVAIAGMGGASIKAASDAAEAHNAMRVTFGTSARLVERFGETSAEAYGVSSRAAFGYAASVGALLKASGLAQEAAASMSVDVVKLAADLGSFKNLSVDDALEKIRAGLVGEVEPLRSVGVLLSADAVKAKAMQMGLAGANDELTEGQKVLARYQLILEQTKDAQGDFGRTLETSLPNQAKVAQASVEELGKAFGTHLIPMAVDATQAVNGTIDAFDNLGPAGEKAALGVGATIAAFLAAGMMKKPAVEGWHLFRSVLQGTATAAVTTGAALGVTTTAAVAGAAAVASAGVAFVSYKSLAEAAAMAGNEFASSTQRAMAGGAEAIKATIDDFEGLRAALEADMATFRTAGKEVTALERQIAELDEMLKLLRDSANAIPGAMGAAGAGMANAAADAERLTKRLQEGAAAMAAMVSASTLAAVREREAMFPSGAEEGAGRGDPGSFPGLTGIDAVKKLQEDSRRLVEQTQQRLAFEAGSGGGASAENPLQDAIDQLQARLNRELSQAFVEGGEGAMTKLAVELSFVRHEISKTAEELMSRLGIDLPAALGLAADAVLEKHDRLKREVEEAKRGASSGFILKLAARRSAIGLNGIEGFNVRGGGGGQPITINRTIGTLVINGGEQQTVVEAVERADEPLLRQVRQSFAAAR